MYMYKAFEETKSLGSEVLESGTHTNFKRGRNSGAREYRIAFVARKNFACRNTNFRPISERIGAHRVNSKFFNVWTLIEDKEESIKDIFCNRPKLVFDSLPLNVVKTGLGNFNIKIGKELVSSHRIRYQQKHGNHIALFLLRQDPQESRVSSSIIIVLSYSLK